MIKVLNIVGARPNFIKIAPLVHAMTERADAISQRLIHTGQHYDFNLSDAFFRDLDVLPPHINLGVGSGSHAEQTAKIMLAFEQVAQEQHPDWIVVVGDVNSTLACSLVAAKLGIRVAHVEAGLRSFDRTMPEEINRILTDALSDLLLTTCSDAGENLAREGAPPEKIRMAGNVMIDSLAENLKKSSRSDILKYLALTGKEYGVVTLHRPNCVDHTGVFAGVLDALCRIARELPLVFPLHPRAKSRIAEFGFDPAGQSGGALRLIEPLGYLDFLHLYRNSRMVLTDSGGIQEETTYLGIPCLTLRENTERPVTIRLGTNRLVGLNPSKIEEAAREVLAQTEESEHSIPPLWDGHAAPRVVQALLEASGVS